jgi:hypothetical protein
VRDAVTRRHSAHRRRRLPRLWTVIDAGKYVAVNIDHLAAAEKSK